MTSVDEPMIVQFEEHASLDMLLLQRPLQADSWKGVLKKVNGAEADPSAKSRPLMDVVLSGFPADVAGKRLIVQHRMDTLGRHEYIDLSELAQRWAKDGREAMQQPLVTLTEEEVKRMGPGAAYVLRATPAAELRTSAAASAVAARQVAQQHADAVAAGADPAELALCPPMSLYCNYSVIDDLTLGRTQRVMLADEATLARGGQTMPPIFNHLSLIVNCHQDQTANRPGKYRVGSAKPAIVFQPVHKLYGSHPTVVINVLTDVVAAMWASLQKGSVVVHCLAGLHRAPAVVACFYLYRHYALGHTHLPADIEEIYRRMRAVRPSVAPLGYIELIRQFHAHMERSHSPT